MSSAIVRNITSKQYSDFDPRSIPGCNLWLDAADSRTIGLSGSSVTSWADKSASGVSITIGGSGGLTYSSVTKSISTASSRSSYFSVPIDVRKTVTPNITLFIVYKWLGQTTNQDTSVFWANDVPNAANRVQFFQFTIYNPNNYGYFLNNGYLYNSASLNTPNLQLYEIVSQVGTSNGTSIYFNGTLTTTGTELVNTPFAGNEILYFGGGETSSIYPSYTQFNEIILYPYALSSSQRQQIEGYLMQKWGLASSLPAAHPFKSIPLFTRPFLASDSNGLQLWLDAADPNTMYSDTAGTTPISLNGTVALWKDKSGNGRDCSQATSNLRPTYANDGVYPGISFSGSGLRLIGVPVMLSTTYAIFIVTRTRSTSGIQYSFRVDKSATNTISIGPPSLTINYPTLTYSSSSSPQTLKYGAAFGSASTATTIITVSDDSALNSTNVFWYNGAASTTTFTGSTANIATDATGYSLGGGPASAMNLDGFVYEIIILHRQPSTYERQQIEGYLAWKWGAQASLAAGSGFKLYRPLTTVFNPLQLSNCAIWFDAADTTTITGTTQVTNWTNKGTLGGSAVNRTLSCTSGSTVNGLNYINCPAGADLQFTLDLNTQARSWFVVSRLRTTLSSGMSFAIIHQTAGTGQNVVLGGYVDASNYSLNCGAWSTSNYIIANVLSSRILSTYMAAFVHSTTTSLNQITLNGTSQTLTTSATAANYSTGSLTYRIGASGFSTSVDVMEILFYYGDLTQSQRQQVEGYLAWKWGIQTTLPTSHPFYKLRA